jgi:hypothetical protein
MNHQKKKRFVLGSEEPREDAGLLEGAVLLERRKEMHFFCTAKSIPNVEKHTIKESSHL